MFKIKQQLQKKGQSTIEYLVVVAGIIAVIIFFLGPTGPFSQRFQNTLNEATNGMTNMAGRLSTSRPLAP